VTNLLDDIRPLDGDMVTAEQISRAVTAGPILYKDGSTQTFDPAGSTTYVENGRPTAGEWSLDSEGRFCSFWPPTYRACYELHWVVEDGHITGLRSTDGGSGSVGRYQ
jgi:hypothetical protein